MCEMCGCAAVKGRKRRVLPQAIALAALAAIPVKVVQAPPRIEHPPVQRAPRSP